MRKPQPASVFRSRVWAGTLLDQPLFRRAELLPGAALDDPALLLAHG